MTWIGGVGMSLGSVEQAADKDTTMITGVAAKGTSSVAGAGAGIGALQNKANKNKEEGGKTGKEKGADMGTISEKK